MLKAVISGDVVSSTSITKAGMVILEDHLKTLLDNLKKSFGVYGRIIKGDYLECYIPKPEDSLRIALAIKSYIKTLPIEKCHAKEKDPRFKFFKIHGIRLAIGYGELDRLNLKKGIIDGEAIYLSGRAISRTTSYQNERMVIKNTLFFVSADERLNKVFDPLLALADVLIRKASSRQSEVLYLRLMRYSEDAVAKKMNISQPAVNQHSTSVGWNAIEKAIGYYQSVIKEMQQ